MTRRFAIRFTAAHFARLQRAARMNHTNASAFIRQAGEEAATEILGDEDPPSLPRRRHDLTAARRRP